MATKHQFLPEIDMDAAKETQSNHDEQLPEELAPIGSPVADVITGAELRDAAAALRSAAARARGRAADQRFEAALLREAGGDRTVNDQDRECERADRQAEAIDNIWTSRDGDAAACDRALLREAARRPD